MLHRGNAGFGMRSAFFVLACLLSLCFVGAAHGEDFNTLLARAKRGDADAQGKIGVMYAQGDGVKQDYNKAREWLEKAAAKHNARAINGLGNLLALGLGVRQDYDKARELYEKAAALNYPPAISNLGYMYTHGQGVRRDYNKARELYEKAAALNNAQAINNLGVMYYQGQGVKRDYNKARELYEKAAAMNYRHAYTNLGVIYEQGKGVKRDYDKARKFYEKAAALNSASAYNNLGIMYEQGKGVRRDYNKARELYEKSAALNDASAYNNLGWMHEQGHGVRQDYSKAREYYEKAAAMDSVQALSNLGRMYENGIGIAVNMDKAIDFYRRAYAEGNTQARKALIRLNIPLNAATKKNTVAKKNASIDQKTQTQNSVPSQNNDEELIIRPRVAIVAFDDKSEDGKAPASAIMNMMVTELYKSGAFTLLERERLIHVAEELRLGQSGLADPSTAPKIGRVAGAQYIMTGAVTLYYYGEKASGFALPILGAYAKAKTAYVVIDLRIVDVETSEIVYASEVIGEATNKERKSLGSSSKVIGGLLGLATRDAVRKHVSGIRGLNLEI